LRKLILILPLLLLLPAYGMAQARSRRKVPAPAAESVTGIELIDFENYTHVLGGRSYKLIGGYYAGSAAPGSQWELRVVEAPYYGDLNGDGKNEALLVLSYGAVAGPHTVEARVYTLRKGRPATLATFPVAESLNCELDHYVDLDDGMVRIERVYGNASRCDHNEVREYRWNGTMFMSVGEARITPCRCM
jgi:hypothetical protein